MKNLITIFILSLSLSTFAQTGIGTTTPNASAQLDVSSTTKGFLPPRMTSAQRDAISSPAEGLTVYCTTDDRLYIFDGSSWIGLVNTETDPSVPTGTQTGQMQYWNGTAWVTVATTENEGATLQMLGGVPTWTGGTPPPPPNVTSTTGRIWMDRNLGASQVATSSTDSDAYGDLYQWGRGTDGHEIRTSSTNSTLATSDNPGHGDFITPDSSPVDWRTPQNDNLWQGVSGINNPCPSGYRLPTDAEWETERTSWGSNNAAGAFGSPLKLPMAGFRFYSGGGLRNVGSYGFYWSSTIDAPYSRSLLFFSGDAYMYGYYRAGGLSVRCIKD